MAQTFQSIYQEPPHSNTASTMSRSIENHGDFHVAISALVGLPAPILVLNKEGRVMFVNTVAESLFQSAGDWPAMKISQDMPNISYLGVAHARTLETPISWDVLLRAQERTPQDLLFTKSKGSRNIHDMQHEHDIVYHLSISKFVVQGIVYTTIMLQIAGGYRDKPTGNQIEQNQDPSVRSFDSPINSVLAQLHNAVLDSTKTVVYLVSADNGTVFFNRAAKALLGEDTIAFIGNDGSKFYNQFDVYNDDFSVEIPITGRPALKLLATQKNVPSVTLGIVNVSTGDRLVINTSGECLYDSGKFIGGLMRIHHHMPAEEYFERKENDFLNSFETVCDQLPHIVWRVTPTGSATYFNTAWTDVTGQSTKDALDLGYKDYIHPEDKMKLDEELKESTERALTEQEYQATAEVRLKRKVDGMWCWHLLRAKCLMKDGVILAWYGTYTEIHQNVIARNRHKKNWNQMTTILRQSAEVDLFAFDTEGRFTLVQGADEPWEHGLRKSPHESSTDMTKLGADPKLIGKMQTILDGHTNTSVLDHEIGSRTYRTRLIADTSKQEAMTSSDLKVRGVLGLSIDITDVQARAALELENATLQAEERVAQENSRKKSEFLANMSHEMRTPLAGIIGLIDLLMDTLLDHEQLDYVTNIRFSCNMLLAVVNDVLDFSKVESGRLDIEKVPFDLNQMLRGLQQLLMPSIDRSGLDLIFKSPESINTLVLGDPSRIRQILLNLLTNAIKFTKKGSVTLSVSTTSGSVCKKIACKDCVCVTFEVTDTGCGMTPEVLAQLFQPFRQGDSSTARLYGGTGLGLTISQNLAKLMHGHLSLKSVSGKGTTSTFTVPLKIAAEEQHNSGEERKDHWNNTFGKQPTKALMDVIAAQTASKMDPPPNYRHGHSSPASLPSAEPPVRVPASSRPRSRNDFKVLVVEDNKINQTIALKTIRKLGFSAFAVWNGQEAVEYLASCLNRADVDSDPPNLPSLILMDAQMPILDGYAATRKLRNESPWKDSRALQAIPIVALTASAIQGDLEKCMASGMNDYMTKPVARDVMEKMLVKWGGDGKHGQ